MRPILYGVRLTGDDDPLHDVPYFMNCAKTNPKSLTANLDIRHGSTCSMEVGTESQQVTTVGAEGIW